MHASMLELLFLTSEVRRHRWEKSRRQKPAPQKCPSRKGPCVCARATKAAVSLRNCWSVCQRERFYRTFIVAAGEQVPAAGLVVSCATLSRLLKCKMAVISCRSRYGSSIEQNRVMVSFDFSCCSRQIEILRRSAMIHISRDQCRTCPR